MLKHKFKKFILLCQALLILTTAPSLAQKIYTSSEAINHIGEFASVKGNVHQVYISSKGNIFLNIDGTYPNNPFSVVIFKSNAHKFPNIKSLEGKTIIVTGTIKLYRGKPEIIVNNPNQIKLIKKP